MLCSSSAAWVDGLRNLIGRFRKTDRSKIKMGSGGPAIGWRCISSPDTQYIYYIQYDIEQTSHRVHTDVSGLCSPLRPRCHRGPLSGSMIPLTVARDGVDVHGLCYHQCPWSVLLLTVVMMSVIRAAAEGCEGCDSVRGLCCCRVLC